MAERAVRQSPQQAVRFPNEESPERSYDPPVLRLLEKTGDCPLPHVAVRIGKALQEHGDEIRLKRGDFAALAAQRVERRRANPGDGIGVQHAVQDGSATVVAMVIEEVRTVAPDPCLRVRQTSNDGIEAGLTGLLEDLRRGQLRPPVSGAEQLHLVVQSRVFRTVDRARHWTERTTGRRPRRGQTHPLWHG